MKRYDICKSESYTKKDGTEKTNWQKVGEVIDFQNDKGTLLVKIPAIGLEATAFPQKERETRQGSSENDYL